jgi:uncharacterized protein (DUF58 family)
VSSEKAQKVDPSEKVRSSQWIDLKTLMAVRNLQWRAQKVVDGFQTGLHRSPKHGFSVEFSEYRPYSVGDDPKTIDWKLYARTDRYYQKRFEDETNRKCYLVVDQSKSMQYGSIDYTKYEYARTLIATLALFLLRQRDAVGAVAFDQAVTDWLTARFRTGQFQRILSILSKPCGGRSTELTAPLGQIAELVKHRSLIVIVSDFLIDPSALKAPLSFLKARKHEVVLLRVLDPLELDFRHEKPVLIRDLESGDERFVDTSIQADSYRRRFQDHRNQLDALLAPLGIPNVEFKTTDPMEQVLSSFLSMREGVAVS